MRLHPTLSLCLGAFFALSAGLACADQEAASLVQNHVADAPDESAEQLLKRMAKAMQTTDYEGLLLHMRGGEARSMRVFHRYDAEQGEREHLLSLDGKPFEVLQDAKGCTCVWPQSRYLVMGHAFNGRLSSERFAETQSLGTYYDIKLLDYARVGGIDCRLLKLEPKDAYRFAYRLCIHEPSAMLLNLEVFDAERRLELNQFTQLHVQKNDTDDIRIFTNIEGFRMMEDKSSTPSESPQTAWQTSWVATQLPPGYRLRSADLRKNPHTHKPLEQMIFSDNLGSVSVFIERLEGSGQSAVLDAAKPQPRGVMQRVVRDVDGYRLTAVGDAPKAAMRMLLDGMQSSASVSKE